MYLLLPRASLTETQVAYTDCSTTSGVLSLDPYVIRFANKTPGFIYGNSGKALFISRSHAGIR